MTEKSYTAGDLTVVWTPDRCIHSAKCVAGLPAVFDPARRPWIDLTAAAADAIRTQVRHCPTGALSLREPATAPSAASPPAAAFSVEVMSNGPLIVRGAHQAALPDGTIADRKGPTAYCRCGASARKPYCDGAHARVGFKG